MRRYAVVTAVLAVAGALVLLLQARPLTGSATEGLGALSWPLLLIPESVLGLLSGLVAGGLARRGSKGRQAAAVVVAVVTVALALLVAGLAVTRFSESGLQVRTNTSDLVAAWLALGLYVVVGVGCCAVVAGGVRGRDT